MHMIDYFNEDTIKQLNVHDETMLGLIAELENWTLEDDVAHIENVNEYITVR